MNQVERDNREGVRESNDKDRRKMEAAQRMEGGIYGHSESGKAQSHTPCPINGGPLKLSPLLKIVQDGIGMCVQGE